MEKARQGRGVFGTWLLIVTLLGVLGWVQERAWGQVAAPWTGARPVTQQATRPVDASADPLDAQVETLVATTQSAIQSATQPITQPTTAPTTQTVRATSNPYEWKLRSPRSAVRTLLSAVSDARETPGRIQEAVACLDLSGIPEDEREKRGALLAEQLEVVIVALGVKSDTMPDSPDGTAYAMHDGPAGRVALRRETDGRWVFDAPTLALVPAMYEQVRKAATTQVVVEAAPNVPPEFASPRATMRTFLQAMMDKKADLAAQCLNLEEIAPAARAQVGPQLAQKLKAIMDRKQFVVLQEIPDDVKGDIFVWLTEEAGRIDIKRQEMPPEKKGWWLFSRATIKSIDRLYAIYSTRPLVRELEEREERAEPAFWDSPSLWLRFYVPQRLKGAAEKREGFYLEPYQWLALPALAGLGWLFRRATLWVLIMLARVFLNYKHVGIATPFLEARLRPLASLAMVALWWNGLQMLDLRLEVIQLFWPAFKLMVTLVAVYSLYRFVDLLAAYALARVGLSPNNASLAPMLIPLLAITGKLTVFAFGIVFTLQLFEWDVTAVLTGLGLSGLAFALAAQDTLKNFFGSLTLLMDRPFYVGDYVKIGTNDGVVESVGLRSTRVRSLNDSVITIPNSELTTTRIDNFGARKCRLFTTTLALTYDTPPDLLVAFRAGIRQLIANHPKARKEPQHAYVHGWSPSSIDLFIWMYFEVNTREEELETREEMVLSIARLARDLGVRFALPSRTIYQAGNQSQEPHPFPPPPANGFPADLPNPAEAGRAAAARLMAQAELPAGVDHHFSDQLVKFANGKRTTPEPQPGQ